MRFPFTAAALAALKPKVTPGAKQPLPKSLQPAGQGHKPAASTATQPARRPLK